MRKKVRELSDRAEFWLVIGISFTYFVSTSLAVLLMRLKTFELSSGRVVRGILTEAALLGLVAWILRERGWRIAHLTRPISVAACVAGIPLFLGYVALYWTTFALVVQFYPAAAGVTTVRMIPAAPKVLLFFFIIINSVFEESLVAGYVVAALRRQHGFGLAVTSSALLRFLYHLYQGPVASLAILPLGLLFGWVYWRWRNLWPLFAGHTIANLISLLLASQAAG